MVKNRHMLRKLLPNTIGYRFRRTLSVKNSDHFYRTVQVTATVQKISSIFKRPKQDILLCRRTCGWLTSISMLTPLIFLLPCNLGYAGQPKFTDLGSITNNADADEQPHIVTDGKGTWVAVWASKQATYRAGAVEHSVGEDYDIWWSRSRNNGITWSDSRPLNANADTDWSEYRRGSWWLDDDCRPRLATDKQGNWIAVWESNRAHGTYMGYVYYEKDTMVAKLIGNGQTWSEPAELNSYMRSDGNGNDDAKPDIAYGDGMWMVVWQSKYDLGGIGADYDIMWSKSTDNGANWSAAAAMNNASDVCRYPMNRQYDDENPHVLYRPSYSIPGTIERPGEFVMGAFLVVWDTACTVDNWPDYDIAIAKYFRPTPTLPHRWTDPVALNTNATSDSGEDRHARVACSGRYCVTVWQSKDNLGGTIETDEDILVSWSENGGSTWSEPYVINEYMFSDTGSDLEPDIATDGKGHWVVAWASNKGGFTFSPIGPMEVADYEIFRATSTNNGASWSEFETVNHAECYYSHFPDDFTGELDEDHHPSLATDGEGNWITIWDSDDGSDSEIDVANVIPPEVKTITLSDTNPTSATSLNFTVNFDKEVSGVDVSDFGIETTGSIAGQYVSSVVGSGSSYTVTVTFSSGTGSVELTVLDDDSITNNQNSLGGWGARNGDFTIGPAYTIDTAPHVLKIDLIDPNPTDAFSVRFRVTFTVNVINVDRSDFAAMTTGSIPEGSSTITTVTSAGSMFGDSVWTVSVNTGSGTGTVRLDVTDDDSIRSGIGIPLGGWSAGNGNYTNGPSYTIDKTPPIAGTVDSDTGPYTINNTQLTFRWLNFSEDPIGGEIDRYEVALGTESDPEAYQAFESVGLASMKSFPSEEYNPPGTLWPDGTYVVTVRAINAVGLVSEEVSYSLTVDAAALRFGEEIPPPPGQTIDWDRTNGTPSTHVTKIKTKQGTGLFVCDYGRAITINWFYQDTPGPDPGLTRLYNTSSQIVADRDPMIIYYTHTGNTPTLAPPVDVAGLHNIIIHYNEAIPKIAYDPSNDTRCLWVDGDFLYARDKKKDTALVILELHDAQGYAGSEIVQVKPNMPDVIAGEVHIGSRLSPFKEVSDAASPVVTRGGADSNPRYIYQHAVEGSLQKGQIWAIRKNDSSTPINMEVVWMRKGLGGVVWPYEFRRYSADWPETNPSKYQLYVRGNSAVALGPKVTIPTDLEVELQEYEKFEDPRHHAYLDNDEFYTDGPGWSLLKYQTGKPAGRDWVGFEVVRSVVHNDTNFFNLNFVQRDIGTEITDPYHEGPGPGYIHVPEGDRYAPKIYEGYDSSTGQIFAVNTGVLEVWWSNLSRIYDPVLKEQRIQWPSKVVRYEAAWPGNTEKIIIAMQNGSGVIDPAVCGDDWSIYYQNESNLPGFNPNDEHAMVVLYYTGSAVFALRDDLGSEATSKPYVLLKYREQPGNEMWRFRVFEVVREEYPYRFADWPGIPNDEIPVDPYEGVAGVLIQPPFPLSTLPYCKETVAVSGPAFEDRNENHWAKSAGNITMRYYYPIQEGFYPDQAHGGPAINEHVPWLDNGTGTPIDVVYKVSWPDAPTMKISQTLIESMYGLPDIKGQGSVDIIYEESPGSVILIDPVQGSEVDLTKIPDDIVVEFQGAEKVFPDLSLALRLRVSYDPMNYKLKFKGVHVEPVTGYDYALLNVMSERERDEMLSLSQDADWQVAVNALYDSAKEPIVIKDSSTDPFDMLALTTGFAQGVGYVTLVMQNAEQCDPLPVSLEIIKVVEELDPGEIIVITPQCPFDEMLTMRHKGDFGGSTGDYTFEWRYLPDEDGTVPVEAPDPDEYDTEEEYQVAVEEYWGKWISLEKDDGAIDVTIEGPGLMTLSDNWFVCRYKYNGQGLPWSNTWSDPTPAQFGPGWIKRVVGDINPFTQRASGGGIEGAENTFSSFADRQINTIVSMISQAGPPWTGNVPMNCAGLDDFGLLQIYETVLNRGVMLSIDGLPPVKDYPPANQALLLVASRIADLYMLLGNEAYADAADPTIAFGTDDGQYGAEASSIHCFMNVTSSLLEEELTLLRGRDDSKAPGVQVHPIYNRLIWNFTNDMIGGEVAYALNYDIQDELGNADGIISEADAQALFPQGHGDAWGHYLTAIKTYYRLLRHPNYLWNTRSEAVLVAGVPVTVDYLDERKFAKAAAAKARTGAEIVNLTYRDAYVEDPAGQWQGYRDSDPERSWGFSEWASRAGQGTYIDWVVGNAILPPEDPDPDHTGIQKIDRTTVLELREVASRFQEIQSQLDTADIGLNPLGLATNVIPFDISPTEIDAGKTHFEQIYDRAVTAMNNAITVFNHANNSTQLLRRQNDTLTKFQRNVQDRRIDFKNRLIEIFGYPYPDDIGPGKNYPTGFNGPDLDHYMCVDPSELVGVDPPAVIEWPQRVVGFRVYEDGSIEEYEREVVFHICTSNDRFGLVKPPEWTKERRAPGEIQIARSDLIQARARFERSLTEYDNLLAQIEDHANMIEAQHNLNAEEINVLNEQLREQQSLNSLIKQSRTRQLNFRKKARIATLTGNALAEALPLSVGFSVDATSTVRSAIRLIGTVTSEIYTQDADRESLAELDHQQAAQIMQAQTNIVLTTLRSELAIQQQVNQLEQLVRQEASLRFELYTMQEVMHQTSGRYMVALARGERLLEDLNRFNKETSAQVQSYRYKDMAFRIFRNDALQKYRAQFDLAARYVYLAAKAYDFETTFLSDDTRAGQQFLSDIVRHRLIGTVEGGIPHTGVGLTDPLARMSQNFNAVKGIIGFNNPQRETNRFSLRWELFDIRSDADGDTIWREKLWRHVVPNLFDVPEFQRYARSFYPSLDVEPGIVIPFETNIIFGLNFFGLPLRGGDSAYNSSNFTTKVRSVGVWFSNYNNLVNGGLSNTPYVYLIPVGNDIQRSPTGDSGQTREFEVLDQVIPAPFSSISGGDLDDLHWIPNVHSLTESFAKVRKYSSFRAYHDSGQFDPSETKRDSRLIGRSVWNTRWFLIIPAGTFHSDREEALRMFIDGSPIGDDERDGNGVSDILIFFETYAYPGY